MTLATRRLPACAVATAAVWAAGARAVPAETAWKWTPEAVVDTVGISGVALSSDGASIVFGRSRWRGEDAKPGPAYVNLWRVPFGGGEPERLTTADAEDTSPHWSPDGRTIAFLSRRGGENAKTRLWLLPAAGGEPNAATDEKTDVLAYEWSPDGRRLAYVALEPRSEQKEKDEKAGKDARLVDQELRPRQLNLLELSSRKPERLASLGELSAWDFAWAPDGSALLASVTERNRMDDSYMLKRLVVLPLQGERRELVGVGGKLGAVAWSHNGRTVAWLGGVDPSDPAPGSVFVAPAAGGTPRNLSANREETATALAWRKDGTLAVTSSVGTRTLVWLVDPASGAWQQALASPPALLGAPSWSDDGQRCAFAGATATQPPEVYAGALARALGRKARPAEQPRRVANSNPQLDGLPRGAHETIRYPAKDGLPIEAVLVRPEGAPGPVPRPLVVVVHGGPESHYLDAWNNGASAPAHLLAERGYLVLFPNYRGSTGRGVAFAKADHRDLGGQEFEDVLAGVDYLVAKGWADSARVGITGGSYGGYFTALAVTRHSERFAAGVELFGITNWESFLGQSDIPTENSLVHWNLWCYEHAALCRERSPVAHWDKARTPTLILQGEKDERVPKPQSDELYAALRFKKVPVEYVVYPREGHGFRERWHRLDALTRTLAWFDRHLAAPSGGGAR